tara:strand:+ start:258 stop:893 length:636 start_codon:yes stop_codon:yes gene_type:complete
MNKFVKMYINKCFEQNFISYPKDELQNVNQAYSEIESTLVKDIKQKYKEFHFNETKNIFDLMVVDMSIEAIMLYRISRNLFLKKSNNTILPFLHSLMRIRTSMELYYSSEIGEGFVVRHGLASVIGPNHVIGKRFTIFQKVTLGQSIFQNKKNKDRMIIGNNVTFSAGVTVIGNIKIGNNIIVGENSIVKNNLESNYIYIGSPAMKIGKFR